MPSQERKFVVVLDLQSEDLRVHSSLTIAQVEQAARTIFREECERLLNEHAAQQRPLMAIGDVARTLSVSIRTLETLLATGELPPPLWVSGQRRWHPDALDAWLRTLEGKSRRGAKK